MAKKKPKKKNHSYICITKISHTHCALKYTDINFILYWVHIITGTYAIDYMCHVD